MIEKKKAKGRGSPKPRKWIRFLCICIGLLPLLIVAEVASEHPFEHAVFSWQTDVFATKAGERMLDDLKAHGINTLYQWTPSDVKTAAVHDFLQEAAERDIAVWMLTGDPQWAFDPSGEKMIARIDDLLKYQKGLEEDAHFRGVMMDCEPYVTDEWDENPDAVMDTWLRAIKNAYEYAQEKNVKWVVCIPFYLDNEGYLPQLKELMADCCDGIAIMNYYKNHEAENISDEVEAAKAADIPVTVIYEMQPPGKHGLRDVNTYYHDGIRAVQGSWLKIRIQLGYEKLGLAYHEYKAFSEVAANE